MATRVRIPRPRLAPLGLCLALLVLLAAACASARGGASRAEARSAPAPEAATAATPAPLPTIVKSDTATAIVPTGRVATPAPTAAPTTEVVVTATELKFDPATISVPAGRRLRLTFVNKGVIEHDWEVVGLKATDIRVVSAPAGLPPRAADMMAEKAKQGTPHAMAGAGQQTTIEFTPTTSGSFDTICTVPGHKEANMVGKLVVTGR